MFELVTPKGFPWSGEDNTSPQIKKITGKNVKAYKQWLFYRSHRCCVRVRLRLTNFLFTFRIATRRSIATIKKG
jgi:hypothetical protein